MDWTNIHAWKSKSLFAHNIQKNRKDVKPYPIKQDNGPLSLAICLGTMVATMFMFFASTSCNSLFNCLLLYLFVFLQGRYGNGNGQEFMDSYKLLYSNPEDGKWVSYSTTDGQTVS